MKRKTLLFFILCNFVYSITLAQQIPNFYSIKDNFDTYYDSLIQVNGIDSMQGTGYNPYKRWIDYWEPLVYPSGDFAIERQKLEQYVSDFVSGNVPQSVAPFTLDWELIGPNKMPDGSTNWDKGLGQIHYIAFDPNDPTNQKMFACSPAGGLWRSLDGGGTWFNTGTDKGLPLCGISSIAIDPNNSETNWFVSTGNGEPMPGGFWAQNAVGVGRTTDGGANWQIIGLENAWQMRKIILTRYQDKVHLFVATTGGLYECEDALASDPQFTELIDGNFYDVEFDPQNTGIAYASGTGPNTSVYKIDWINNVYTELPDLSSIFVEDVRRLIIEISPAAPQYLFIAATYKEGIKTSYLYRYDLLTNSLFDKGELPGADANQQGIGPERAMGWTISPVLNNNNELIMVYGNTAPIRQSNNLLDDNNCVWNDVTSTYHYCEIHVDMHYMTFEPDGQTLWVGSDGGVFKSTMPDLINNWEEKCNGLAVATIHHLAISEKNKDISLSGAYDCGSNLYTRNNNEWNEKHVVSGDGFQCQFNWDKPDTMWASPQYSIKRSYNGGDDWSSSGYGFHWHTYFIQNNVYPEILYGANQNGIKRSTDYGESWDSYYANYPGVNNNKTWRIASSLTHGNYIYTSWYGRTSGNPHKVFKSVTGGGTNTSDWEDVGSPLFDNWISSIAVDYFDPDHIWVAAGGKVYDVNTISKQWVNISNGLPSYIRIEHLEVLPGANGILYAGTNYGLYYYTTQESVWQYVDGNLPNVNVSDIQIDMTSNRIVVGTFGRGVWEAGLPCITSNEITYITSDQTWQLDKYIVGTISIEPSKTLTIHNSTIKMNKDAKIIVKPGAKLIIDGGTLTNACSEVWQGIEIWGNSNAHQYPGANGNYQQGYVELKNDAVIENAYNAITLWKPDDWQSMGGILIANDATFRNNRRAVEFMSYQNFDPATGDPRPNKSQFVDCIFETDENYLYTGNFSTFVSMWKVDGIKFYGCDFEDKRVAFQDPPYYQSVGIWTIDANFYVLPDCGDSNYDCWSCPDPYIDFSSFTGLNIAVYSSQERTNNSFVIDHTNFVNNLHGIYNAANNYASCIRSDFEIGTKQLAAPYYIPLGIYNYSSTGFTFNQNDFTPHASLPPDIDFSTGIWNLNTGEDINTVYNNNFIGLGYGNIASGDNHNNYDPYIGLIYKCNHNSANLKYDFYIYDGEGIATFQGIEDVEAAGNTFCHNTTPDGSDFANLATWPVNYFYYEGNSDEDPINTIGVWKEGAPENLCEDRYIINSNIRLSETEKDNYRQQYYDNKMEYDNTRALYESLKDGGSTPDTKFDIENSWPDETWELRAQLLADSPHLTEEVLMAAADKSDVLPHTILFEICIANPEEMRNEGFLEYLATKDDPMPQYMIDNLRDGADEDTYKGVLQNEMAGYAFLWGTACNNLIRDIVLDSIGMNYDSLRLWLSNKESLTGEYEIVDSYLAEDDLTNALAHLNNIPTNFELSDKHLEEYNYFHDLKTTIINAQQQGRNIFQLDSLEILDLVYIADTSKYLAGVQAQSILNFAYGYSYFDLPDLQEPNMKGGQIQNYGFNNKTMQEGNHYISAHPNPASQWVAIDYTLPYPSEKATIIIYNAFGKIVKTIELRAVIGQSIWDIRKIPSGIYFYSLQVNGAAIDKRKLIISK